MKALLLLTFLALAACCPVGRPVVFLPVPTNQCTPIALLRDMAEGVTPDDVADTDDFESFEIQAFEDLNNDGHTEYLAVSKSRAFTLSWIVARNDEECHRDVYPSHQGEPAEVTDTYTNGWRDIIFRVAYNTVLPQTEQRHSLVLLTFDGTVYRISEVFTCENGLGTRLPQNECNALIKGGAGG